MSNREKTEGSNQAKRNYTTKPNKEGRCKFTINVHLDEGNCWYIPDWLGSIWHNHQRYDKSQLRHRMAVLPLTKQYENAVYSRKAGATAARAIQSELDDFHFSETQIRYNKTKHDVARGMRLLCPSESKVDSPGKYSDAEDLIRHLEKDRGEGKISFIAMYHTILGRTVMK